MLRLNRSNPLISRTSALENRLCMMYWCPQPTQKTYPILQVITEAMRRPARFVTETEVPSSASKIVRTETQSSVENITRKRSVSGKKKGAPSERKKN